MMHYEWKILRNLFSFFYEASGPAGIDLGVQNNKSTENPHYLHTNIPNGLLPNTQIGMEEEKSDVKF